MFSRDTLEMYSAQVKSIAKILIAKMGEALQIKPEETEDLFGDDMLQSMRMNYYPPCPEPHQVIGLTPHSDAVALTILLQVNEVEGLQIKKDAKWVSVKPLPNAFIVNVGDILEVKPYYMTEHVVSILLCRKLVTSPFGRGNVDHYERNIQKHRASCSGELGERKVVYCDISLSRTV